MGKVYTGYHGTSEIEHGLYACTERSSPSSSTGAQTMVYLSLIILFASATSLFGAFIFIYCHFYISALFSPSAYMYCIWKLGRVTLDLVTCIFVVVLCCVVVLVHGKHLRSCRDGQLT